MAPEPALDAPRGSALAPLAPGPLLQIAKGPLVVDVAPVAGGRIAQISYRGVEQLRGYEEAGPAMITWGCYPMVPWAGRIREGKFHFQGHDYRLAPGLGEHAIHGVGFAMEWRVEAYADDLLQLSLELPRDERWPFGGVARQRIEVGDGCLKMGLSIQAQERALPAVIGWHPWFRKPRRLDFSPTALYPRDAQGIATVPVVAPSAGPWDDCFINRQPVSLEHADCTLRLTSDCTHWVVYDQTPEATCVEPQSGPPDGFNLEPAVLAPGETLRKWFLIKWS